MRTDLKTSLSVLRAFENSLRHIVQAYALQARHEGASLTTQAVYLARDLARALCPVIPLSNYPEESCAIDYQKRRVRGEVGEGTWFYVRGSCMVGN